MILQVFINKSHLISGKIIFLLIFLFIFVSCYNNHIPQISNKNINQEFPIKVSYYGIPGGPLDNKLTASGEAYNSELHTAAHRDLPFGTILKVKNPKTKHWILVRINDRGPGISGRELDLSYGAASALGILDQGVCTVLVTLIPKNKISQGIS